MDTTNDWWISLVLERKKSQTWEAFKKVFFRQFLDSDFEDDVKMEWNWLTPKEKQNLHKYIAKFWKILMRVTPFMKISEEKKKRKFVVSQDYFPGYDIL